MSSGCVGRPSRKRWWLWAVPIAALLALVAIPLVWGGDPRLGYLVAIALIAVSLATAGWAVRRAMADRHRFEAMRVARARSEATRDERQRLAAELHDLVSNGIGMMTVRAAAARRVDDRHDHRAALADIEQLGRRSTREMRRMLALLGSPAEHDAGASPLTFAALPHLVEDAQAAGLIVDWGASTLPSLPAGLELVCCSVIREGLANAARHVGPTTVSLDFKEQAGVVTVSVVDTGSRMGRDSLSGSGRGLARLEERVCAVGGMLTYGPFGEGFQLIAEIPLDPA